MSKQKSIQKFHFCAINCTKNCTKSKNTHEVFYKGIWGTPKGQRKTKITRIK